MKNYLIIVLVILCVSCNSENKRTSNVIIQEDATITNYEQRDQPNYTIKNHWELLSDSIGGCLAGGQYCYNGKFSSEGCCFDNDVKWKFFFRLDKVILSEFLITQLPDTSKTIVHVCPFYEASRGELAVYALQRIYKINWFELSPKYYKYRDGTLEGGKDYYSEQEELQKELEDSIGLKLITDSWLKIITDANNRYM